MFVRSSLTHSSSGMEKPVTDTVNLASFNLSNCRGTLLCSHKVGDYHCLATSDSFLQGMHLQKLCRLTEFKHLDSDHVALAIKEQDSMCFSVVELS